MPWSICPLLLLLVCLPQLAWSIGECKTDVKAKCRAQTTCPACLTIRWSNTLSRPPYVNKVDNTTMETMDLGLLFTLLANMLSECCGFGIGGCGDVRHLTDVDERDLSVSYDVHMPVLVNFKENGLRSQKNVVPMLPHTGVAFIVRRDRIEKDYSLQLLGAVFGAWPVLVLTLLLSVLAGIIAWVLDTRKNPNEFPRAFIKGACEGFWWAFVSMTTVGYGDRSPKSLQGRAFAVIWILIGICIISIFTATLTTSLTTVSLENKISLPGSKVATLLYSIEAINGFQQQADVRRYNTFEEIIEAMDSGTVDGALLDSYVISYFKERLPDSVYKVQEVIHQESLEYGAFVNDSDLATCLRNFRYSKESIIYEMVEFNLEKPLTSGMSGEGSQNSHSSVFDPDSNLFRRTLYTCLGIVGIFFLLGLFYEIIRRNGHFKRANERRNTLNMNNSRPPLLQENREVMLDEMERRLTEELHKAIGSWKTKFGLGDSYNLQTDEILSSV